MEDSSYSAMIKLTMTNYIVWKPQMEDLLNCKDLFDPIEENGVKAAATPEKDRKKSNKKIISQIRQWIDHSVFHHVAQETDT